MAWAGRPRLEGTRTASGALSRSTSAYQNDRPGILMRMRRYRLGYDDAREAKAGDALGRLVLAGELAPELELVGLWYRGTVSEYRRAIRAPEALRRGDGRRARLEVTAEYEAWAIGAVESYDEMAAWLSHAQKGDRHHRLALALDSIVIQDQDAPHLVPSLKAALLALLPFFMHRRWLE